MTIIYTPVASAGSVTAPSALPIVIPGAKSLTMFSGLPVNSAPLPGDNGLILADGVSRMKMLWDDVEYNVGGLAPKDAMTATPTGAQATALFDIDVAGNGASIYNPANNESVGLVTKVITFVTTLSASPTAPEVLIAATGDLTLDNFKGMIDDTKVEGVDYQFKSSGERKTIRDAVEVVSHPVSYQLNLRAIAFGVGGNALHAYLNSGTWTDSSLGSTGATVGTVGYFAGGSATTGTTPEAGSRLYKFSRYRSADGAETGLSPAMDDPAVTSEAGEISLAAMVNSPDGQFDYVRWYRTTDLGSEYYRGQEVAVSGTTDTDDLTDAVIEAPGNEAFDEGVHRSYREGIPVSSRYVATWRGRVWAGGISRAADRTVGTANVTVTSDSVVMSEPVTEDMVGRTFQVDSTPVRYKILQAVLATKTITLDSAYEGATNGTAGYTIRDERDANAVYFSEVEKPNNWPSLNQLTQVLSDDPEGITGLFPHGGALLVFTRKSTWAIVPNGDSFDLESLSNRVGCISHKSIIAAEGAVWWMGRDGIYGWQRVSDEISGSPPEKISSQVTRGEQAIGIDTDYERINFPHAHQSFASYDRPNLTLIFHAPLDDAVSPSHGFCFDLGTRHTWALDDVENRTSASEVIDATGNQLIVAGDRFGALWHMENGNSDGAYGFEPVQTISSSTVSSFTLGSSVMPTTGAGLSGVPVLFVSAVGALTQSTIVSNTGTVGTLPEDMSAAPTGTVIIGGIAMVLRTGRFDVTEIRRRHLFQDLHLQYSPDSDGDYSFFFAIDQGADELPAKGHLNGDLSNTRSNRKFRVQRSGYLHRWGVACLEPGVDPSFLGYEMVMRVPDDLDLR